jgi:hypothetical protein
MVGNVQAALAARIRPRLKRLGLTLENTLEELRRLAYACPGVEDANGELLPVSEWPKEDRQTILQTT